MHYSLSYKNPHQHLIDIQFTIPNVNSDELLVQLPAWRPGRYELANYAQNVKTFQAKDSSGKKLVFSKVTKDCWKIETNNSNSITIEYSYYANELNAGSSFLDETQLYVNPVNCLLYVPGRINDPCELELKLPKKYQVATGLKNTGANKFSASSYHELADCPFIASPTLQKERCSSHGVNFTVWFQGEIKPDWKKILSDFKKFTDAEFKLFGSFPFTEYHFLFQILPTAFYHGVEHTNSTVIALGPSYEIMNEKYDDFAGVSSHELFHAWNVKTIRPIEMMPYDYSRENYSRLGYVAEGVTTYYGDVMLFRSGVFTEAQYLKELNKTLERHFNNPGRLNLSVADSSFDTWLDGYKQSVPGRKSSIYVEGALCAFMLDVHIRKQTKNKKSLDDVMRLLYNEFGKNQKGYSESDYKNAAEQIAGKALDDFFDSYIWGAQSFEPELKNCLDYLGFELKKEKNNTFAERKLGLKVQEASGKTTIASIHPGSPADKAGLAIQDEVMAINKMKVEGNLNAWCRYFSSESKFTLTIASNKFLKEVVVIPDNDEYFPVFKSVKQPKLSNSQMGNFNSWATFN